MLTTTALRITVAVTAVVITALFMGGCSTSYPNRNPTGETFPSVAGESLEREPTRIPEAFADRPTVLLIGYLQETQFDIDRWLMGLVQAKVDARLVEIPTNPGLVPTLVSGWIDNGMRSGIPEEDWGAVVTLYGSAARPVAKLTGNEKGRNTRVVLLDRAGQIVWFDDTGYSTRKVLEIQAMAAAIAAR